MITREDLPYLEVEFIEEGPLMHAQNGQPEYRLWRLLGTVSSRSIVDPTSWCALLAPNRKCLYGDWAAPASWDGKVQFETAHEPTSVVKGTRLHYAGSLDARAAILIEDGPSAWQELTFEPKDAVSIPFIDESGHKWRKISEVNQGTTLEPEAEIIHNGWDHEHCLICNAHIEAGDRFYRHQSENEFLCARCYGKYGTTGDLSFLTWSTENSAPSESR